MLSKIGSNSIAFGIKPEELEVGKSYKHTNGDKYTLLKSEKTTIKGEPAISITLMNWNVPHAGENIFSVNKGISSIIAGELKGNYKTGEDLDFLV
ncbi:MAG: hypothetical protein KAQ92_05530 [Candidatus Aenigmarchaeota archaeon]|nr:hypothetical protein [Candidatus Aenigmarchaeota archaeon]